MLQLGLILLIVVMLLAGAFFLLRKPASPKARPPRKQQKQTATPSLEATAEPLDLSQGKGQPSAMQPAAPPDQAHLNIIADMLKEAPTIPTAWTELQTAIAQELPAPEIVTIIKHDPSLAAAILRIAQGVSGKNMNDLGHAIVFLGYTAVRSIALKHYCGHLTSLSDLPYPSGQLWMHAMAVTSLARICARHIHQCNPGIASTIGLLHDIGRLGINAYHDAALSNTPSPEQGYLLFEHETFGYSHLDVGTAMAKQWRLSPNVIEGIRYHHHPAFTEPESVPQSIRSEVLAVYLGDMLAIHFGFAGGNPQVTLPKAGWLAMLSMDLKALAESQEISKELARLKAMNF